MSKPEMSKPDHLFLKPVKGRLVRDPKTKAKLSEKGERKPMTSYWMRRLRSGDVVKVKVEESKTNG